MTTAHEKRELEELRSHNALLQNQIDRMREVYASRAMVLFDLFLDGISYCVREADSDHDHARLYGARLDTVRVALGLPPRPHVNKPDPEAIPRIHVAK